VQIGGDGTSLSDSEIEAKHIGVHATGRNQSISSVKISGFGGTGIKIEPKQD
jgi:hypothetical protein